MGRVGILVCLVDQDGVMDVPPVLADQTLQGMLAALAVEPDAAALDLAGAVFRSGWESVVVELDRWIVRFPRDADHAFDTELAVLAHVEGRLGVQTPRVAWVGRHTRCMAYPKIIGAQFDPVAWSASTPTQRARLADSLAELLSAWRETFTEQDIDRLGIEPLGLPYQAQLRSAMINFPEPVRAGLQVMLDTYARRHDAELRRLGAGVLHGDFHLGNMALADPTGPVTGLWDFSCVAVGAPSWDLHYLAGELALPCDGPHPPGAGPQLALADAVNRGLGGPYDLDLCDLMVCAEWIGDHAPAEAVRWRIWLDGFSGAS